MPSKRILTSLAALAALGLTGPTFAQPPTVSGDASQARDYGLAFTCPAGRLSSFEREALHYLEAKGIPASWLEVDHDLARSRLQVRLAPAMTLPSTVAISRAPQFRVSADLVELLDPRRAPKQVAAVSQKEILLALLHPGRITDFEGVDCGLEALQDEVGVRQSVSAWAQTLQYEWPEGGPASWNETYWDRGTIKPAANLHEGLTDMLIAPSKYAIGCHTAAKMVISAATLDFYERIKGDAAKAGRVRAALMRDGDPLVDVDPPQAWHFEEGHDPARNEIEGKLLDIRRGVGAGSFVPGDWLYLLNTDRETYQKTGYEGSNAIYLGMDRFSDYYNDHEHSFSYRQKVNEVYQWRHKVFSRSRDAAKVVPLHEADYQRLSATPEHGGLLMDFRLVPKTFAH